MKTEKAGKKRKNSYLNMILKMAYLFGCYSRKDMSRLFFAGEETLNRQYNLVGNAELFSIPRVGSEGTLFLPRDRFWKNQEEVFESFAQVQISETAELRCKVIAQFLSEKEQISVEAFTKRMEDLEDEIDTDDFDEVDFEAEIRKKRRNYIRFLDRFVELGFLIKNGNGKTSTYRCQKPVWKQLTIGEQQSLTELIQYCSHVQKPQFYGYQILKTMESGEVPFTYTKNLDFMLFDEERICEIEELAEVYPCLKVRYVTVNRSYRGLIDGRNQAEICMIPCGILWDMQYGRSYLLGYSSGEKKIISVLIDRIQKVSGINGKTENPGQIEQILKYQYGNAWLAGGKGETDSESVTLRFQLDDEKQKETEMRIRSEGMTAERKGSFWQEKNGAWYYEIDVDNWIDIIPWIRSFGGGLKLVYAAGTVSGIDCKDEICTYLRKSWEEALRQYDQVGVI